MKPQDKGKLLPMKELESCLKNKLLISGKILLADPDEEAFKVLIGYNSDDTPIIGILPFEDYSIQPLSLSNPSPENPNRNVLGKDAIFSGGNWIKCYITSISDKIYLSRKLNQAEFYFNLHVGMEVICTITGLSHPSTFVDIGNGIHALNRIQELSASRYEDVTNWFEVGEKFPAIITEITPEGKIFVSRKKYYEKNGVDDVIREKQMRVCRICSPINNGYFVELNPLSYGIMDIDSNIKCFEGEEVVGFVQKVKQREDGVTCYHLKFCSFV